MDYDWFDDMIYVFFGFVIKGGVKLLICKGNVIFFEFIVVEVINCVVF